MELSSAPAPMAPVVPSEPLQLRPPTPAPITPLTSANGTRPPVGPSHDSTPARKTPLASAPRATPLRHGITMGLAGGLSCIFLACCLMSVVGLLGAHPILNGGVVILAIIVGVRVGMKSFHHRKTARPFSRGRCPDCGQELITPDPLCGVCGCAV